MTNNIRKMKAEQGFTLIELMIVVAIIGILAAIAIPQFSAYRIKAFNSAAESDLRNLRLTSEAFYTDNQSYAPTYVAGTAAGGGALGAGTALTASGVLADAVATHPVSLVSVSNNVTIIADTDATGSSFTAEAIHLQGDRSYAIDSDATPMYWAARTAGGAWAATAFAPAVGTDEVGGTASGQTGATGNYAAL